MTAETDPDTGLSVGPQVDATPAVHPDSIAIEGQYARLEPLDRHHAADLLAASSGEGAPARFRYLADGVPETIADVERWIESADHGGERVGYAIIDRVTGRAEGRLFFLRIATAHRRIEIGDILFGPAIARTRVATEAVYLLARQCFDAWRYRRFEWKCDRLNAPSRCAAERFGFEFEGVFRQDVILKGRSRDTAWYAMTDGDWPALRTKFECWLAPDNFDADGGQRRPLAHFRR